MKTRITLYTPFNPDVVGAGPYPVQTPPIKPSKHQKETTSGQVVSLESKSSRMSIYMRVGSSIQLKSIGYPNILGYLEFNYTKVSEFEKGNIVILKVGKSIPFKVRNVQLVNGYFWYEGDQMDGEGAWEDEVRAATQKEKGQYEAANFVTQSGIDPMTGIMEQLRKAKEMKMEARLLLSKAADIEKKTNEALKNLNLNGKI